MREQLVSARSLKYISVAEAVFIIYLIGLCLYLLANVGQSSSVTVTPPITFSSPAVTIPNDSQQPTRGSTTSQTDLSKI